MNRLATLLLVGIGSTSLVAQSRTPEPTAPNIRKLVSFDSGHVGIPVMSPNGRWVAFDAGGSLWIAPTSGQGRAVRITSSGYKDFLPFWFPSGDALTFTSNRAARNGASKWYGMTIAIDPNTGRAAGPPRAVTTDEVSIGGFASPDGKRVAYVTSLGDSLKIVPSTGGTATFVAKVPDGQPSPPTWSADGTSLVFASPWRGPRSTWYRVTATGGTPIRTEHAPIFGALHVHRDHDRPPIHLELRDSTERVVSTLDVPVGMNNFIFPYATAAVGVSTTQRMISHIYSVQTGAHRVIDNWADGWTSDGKNYVVEMLDNGSEQSVSVGVQDASGKILSRVSLGPDPRECCAWSGVVGSAVTFARGSNKALWVADPSSGRVKEMAPDAEARNTWDMPLYGRGTQNFSDGGRFLYTAVTEQAVEVRAVDADSKSTLLRAFSTRDSTWLPKFRNGGHGIGVRADRVAWTDRTKDSITVWVARGPEGAAHRVAAFASPECTGNPTGPCHTEVVWSERGDALALVTMDDHPLIAVMRVRADGTLDGAPSLLQPGVRSPWCVRWVDGDQALVMTATRRGPAEDIVIVPVRAGSPARALTNGDAPGEWMWVSPDGKEILYPETVTTGSSIWRLDFVPTNSAGSTGKAKQ